MGKRSKTPNAKVISDRSGFTHRMRDMVKEPGTGYLVHKSESDGKWNLVDHPLNNISRYVKFGDPHPVENARPERSFVGTNPLGLVDFDGQVILVGGYQSGEESYDYYVGNYLVSE